MDDITQREDVKALLARKSNLPTTANAIKTEAEFKEADALLLDINALLKQTDELRFSITRPIDQQKKDVLHWFQSHLTTDLTDARSQLTRQIRIYQGEQERIRREAAAAAAEKARKEQERLDKRAAAAEEKGQAEKAAELREQADATVPVIDPITRPKSQAVQNRENWQFQVVNERDIPSDYMTPDLKAIGAVVKALKGRTQIPGVRVYDANSLAALKAS